MNINSNISKKNLTKVVNLAKKNFDKWSKFTIEEFRQILDHVVNSDFIERQWLHKQVPAITFEQMEALQENRLKLQMDMTQASSLIHEVMGGKEGTGIDETNFVVGVWGSEMLERMKQKELQ